MVKINKFHVLFFLSIKKKVKKIMHTLGFEPKTFCE
jgi:hypothetical protein